jgi:hypothetical protein
VPGCSTSRISAAIIGADMARQQRHARADLLLRVERWDGSRLGVRYAYADGSQDAHPVGPDDWPQIRKLNRAGDFSYDSNKARELAAKLAALGLDGSETPNF